MTQLDFTDYAGQPAARGGDPVTSKLAALLGGRSVHKALVCRALYEHGPMHDEQIGKVIDRPKSATIKRRLDLVRMGLVTEATLHGAPIYAKTDAGAASLVWRLTADGRDAAAHLPALPVPDRKVTVKANTLVGLADSIDHLLTEMDDLQIGLDDRRHDILATIANELRSLT